MPNTSLTRILVATAAVIVILAGVKLAGEIVIPFLLSLFIAIVCSPIISFMTKRKVPLWLAITLLFVLIAVCFLFLAGMINGAIQEFSRSIPQYRTILNARLAELTTLAQHLPISLDLPSSTIAENLDPSIVMNLVKSLLTSFSGVVSNVFMLLLVVVFMLFELPTIKHKLAFALSGPAGNLEAEERHIDRMVQGIIGYLGVKTVVSILTSISIWILLILLDVQYAVLWATLSFLLNYIPNIGSILAAVPIILQAFLLNGASVGLGVTLGVIASNVIIGNVIEPRMMGRKLGLSTLVIFLSLLFWGWLLGTVGMLLSVPLTMALKIALESNPNTLRYAILLGDVNETVQVPKS